MNIRKVKSISTKLTKIDNHTLSGLTRIIFEHVNNRSNIYIDNSLLYRNYKICLSKNNIFYNANDKDIEYTIRKVMRKNKGISQKDISKLTNLSKNAVSKFYMKIRREQYARVLY